MRRTLVWDLPVRLLHWLFAAAFVASFALAESGDDDPRFALHMALGLLVGLIAALRVAWGLFGTAHARFTGFALAPSGLLRYVRGLFGAPAPAPLGHNPASSYATLAMLAFALGLAVSGVALARGNEGAKELHELCAAGLLLVSVAHVLGVIWHHLRHRDGIALSILDGKKRGAPDSVSVARRGSVALSFAAVIAAAGGLLWSGYDDAAGTLEIPGVGWTLGEAEDEDDDDDHDDHDDGEHRRRDDGGGHRRSHHRER
jgi:cytochrome b